ncbi:MAG: histidine--tRNA ligase [Clostridiales bacterium]|nr:histidine--tRNA ligase [Clostridiales bacterium]
MEINTKVLSGFMELLPHEQVEFDRLKTLIESTFRSFGFSPLDTPVIERSEVLLANAGAEINKQVYFAYNGPLAEKKDALALRFDLTVPLARYVAEHFSALAFPFRRMHIGKVYRGERAQKGRFREFYQCDIDVIGRNSLSLSYDAELPAIIYQLFKRLNFGKFTIRINNRKVLGGFIAELGATADASEILRIVDKAEKIPREKLLSEFVDLGLNDAQVAKLLEFMGIKGSPNEILERLGELNIPNEIFATGVSELATVVEILEQMGIEADYFAIDLAIARGLDYYTGTVYETILDEYPGIGSVCSGGRYDNLAENYTKEKLPGVGISIGLTRLFWQLREIGLILAANKSVADVIVLPQSPQNMPEALKVAAAIRQIGLNVDILFEDIKMNKKLQYVTKKDAPYLVVARTNDEGESVLSLQYKDGEELKKAILPLEELVATLAPTEVG